MSNGPVTCCLIGACCSPRVSRIRALARLLFVADKKMEASPPEDIDYEFVKDAPRFETMAEAVLEKVDLVPRGLGDAILRAYIPNIAHAIKEGKVKVAE